MPRLFCSHFLSFIWLQNSVNVCQSHWTDFWGELNLCKSLAACLSSGWSETVHSWCWRGLWELSCFFFIFIYFFFKVDLARMHRSNTHPCGCLSPPFNSSVQTGDTLTSDDLVFFVGFSPSHLGFPLQSGRETCCLGQLTFLRAKAVQLLSCVRSCV